MQPRVYFFCTCLFDVGVNFKNLKLIKSKSFEMNQQDTYKEVQVLCWMDENYACIGWFYVSNICLLKHVSINSLDNWP